MKRKFHVRCRAGEKVEITSKPYLLLLAISVRGNNLISFGRQGKVADPTFLSDDIAEKAMELFIENYRWDNPIRSLGVRGSDLVTADRHIQIDLFNPVNHVNAESLEQTI